MAIAMAVFTAVVLAGCGSAEDEQSQRRLADRSSPTWQEHARLGGHLMATVWRTQGARVCAWVETPTNKAGPICAGRSIVECKSCMERLAHGSDAAVRFAVGGSVPSGADQLRVAFVDGSHGEYPVEGEVFPAAPQFRVFGLPLGDGMYRRIEIISEGRVVETADIAPREIARMECFARFPHPPGTIDFSPELEACLQEADTKRAR